MSYFHNVPSIGGREKRQKHKEKSPISETKRKELQHNEQVDC